VAEEFESTGVLTIKNRTFIIKQWEELDIIEISWDIVTELMTGWWF